MQIIVIFSQLKESVPVLILAVDLVIKIEFLGTKCSCFSGNGVEDKL